MSLKLINILNVLQRKGNAGASIDDFRTEFGDEEMEDIKRLVQAAQDLEEIKKDGKGRGVRYYLINVEVPKSRTINRLGGGGLKRVEGNFVEGVIDLTGCVTVKEKIDRILNSDHKLEEAHSFFYRRKIDRPLLGRDLYDHMGHGAIDVDVRVGNVKNKNVIIGQKEKILNNKLIISREQDGQYAIVKIHYECPDRPEIMRFVLYSEFEKCLKTLQPK